MKHRFQQFLGFFVVCRMGMTLTVSNALNLFPTTTTITRRRHINPLLSLASIPLFKSQPRVSSSSSMVLFGTDKNENDDGDNKNKNDNDNDDQALKDFSSEISALFGNIRIPAALFAGASAGAAFAMPISHTASEGLKVGMVKRLYSLLLVGALSSEIVAVVVSTVAVASLSHHGGRSSSSKTILTKTLSEYLKASHYMLPWVSARFHFLIGVLWFVMGLGLRAWVTIVCPIFAYAALGIISSATLLCIAFIEDLSGTAYNGGDDESMESFFALPFRYNWLLFQKAKRNPFFAIAFGLYAWTMLYIVFNVPHVWRYLATN